MIDLRDYEVLLLSIIIKIFKRNMDKELLLLPSLLF